MTLENLFVALFIALALGELGNYLADQATLRDCATKGEAVMKGGGTIKCSVKENAP